MAETGLDDKFSPVGRATVLSLPDISVSDGGKGGNHKAFVIVEHRNVGHEQHVPDLPGCSAYNGGNGIGR